MDSHDRLIWCFWIWVFFDVLPLGYIGAKIESGAGNSTGHVQLNVDLAEYCTIKIERLGHPGDVFSCIDELGDLAGTYRPLAGPRRQ